MLPSVRSRAATDAGNATVLDRIPFHIPNRNLARALTIAKGQPRSTRALVKFGQRDRVSHQVRHGEGNGHHRNTASGIAHWIGDYRTYSHGVLETGRIRKVIPLSHRSRGRHLPGLLRMELRASSRRKSGDFGCRRYEGRGMETGCGASGFQSIACNAISNRMVGGHIGVHMRLSLPVALAANHSRCG
jgi:hypothetical protein